MRLDRARRVCVVVPCYNYGSFLGACVESVLAQDGVDVRVLVIDDASTDDSARVAAEIAAADRRVEVLRHSTNRGHIGTYNEGIEWADGEYTVLLDADDMLTPGALRRACALMEKHPKVGFVYGRAVIIRDGRPTPRARTGSNRSTIWPGQAWLERRCRTAENCIHQPEVVMRASLLGRIGGLRHELPHTGDFELWLRLAVHADVGYIAGSHQAYYRDHAAGMHRRHFSSTLGELGQFKAAFELLFRDHGDALPERDRLEDLARRGLARRALRAASHSYDRGDADAVEVAWLEAMAVETYAAAHGLVEGRGLRWRKKLGPRLCHVLRPFLLLTHARRARRELGRRMERAGF